MGIRYYAYAFDGNMTHQAIHDPDSIVSFDPLADAWGFTPGATGFLDATFEHRLLECDFLYLDKAWSGLQKVTAPENDRVLPRAAFRMFEGNVRWGPFGHDRWMRIILPREVTTIAADLATLSDEEIWDKADGSAFLHQSPDEQAEYMMDSIQLAKNFVEGLATSGRGFIYLIC